MAGMENLSQEDLVGADKEQDQKPQQNGVRRGKGGRG